MFVWLNSNQGRIQDFKLGGAHLKKLRRAERKFLGYFVWTFFYIFSNFRGGGGRRVRPPLDPPLVTGRVSLVEQEMLTLSNHTSSPPVLSEFVLLNL